MRPLPSLVLDLGNTALKYGLFFFDKLCEAGTLADPTALRMLVQARQPHRVIAANVQAEANPWLAELAHSVPQAAAVPTPAPRQCRSATPTLRPPRWGPTGWQAAVGAAGLRPGQPTLVVDAGTALKLDLVTADGTYHGGSIGPGLGMRLRALHAFTGRLPLLALPAPDATIGLVGGSTTDSILSGVVRGAAAEVDGLVAQYRRQWPGLAVLLTGGDAPFLAAHMAGRTFVVPELVLLGLYRILAYNVEQ